MKVGCAAAAAEGIWKGVGAAVVCEGVVVGDPLEDPLLLL